ncbi:hypothetical protein B0H10DRAFT_2239554 [Mycena sp. CBHHK59/15]|nr:hypothetical protein B0H10DRAFT_2239554 [Mycena sp. CBHHK59/15]
MVWGLFRMVAQYGGITLDGSTRGTPHGDQRSLSGEVPSPSLIFETIVPTDISKSVVKTVRRRYTRQENKRFMKWRRRALRASKEPAEVEEEAPVEDEDPRWCYSTPCTLKIEMRGDYNESLSREVPNQTPPTSEDHADVAKPDKVYTVEEIARHVREAMADTKEWDDLQEASPAEFANYLAQIAAEAKTGEAA